MAFGAPVAGAQEMDHGAMGHSDRAAPATSAPRAMDHSATGMSGALGPHVMAREASGTSWQPDSSTHGGVHGEAGNWMLMSHLVLNGVYADESGARGDSKTFVAGMGMVSARRDFARGEVLNLRAMLGPDPFMGKRGYPSLLAAGETADGATTLRDRQHPHDLFMELSAAVSRPLGDDTAAFLYAGLPGEPAFGPPAFMHRQSAMNFPLAPITHHWLDSTHITFGVVTAGVSHARWKVETSGFRGREPDESRFDIETPRFDSAAARVSWNPTESLALQASWAEIRSPEQLHPDDDETRYAASALHTLALSNGGSWATTLAWGRKSHGHGDWFDGLLIETTFSPNTRWSLFARAEQVETEELSAALPAQRVGKLSVGALHDWPVAAHVKFGAGALVSFVDAPAALGYGAEPRGAMAFVRLKVD